MTRPDLGSPPVAEEAARAMSAFHAATIEQVRQAIAAHPVVVVGMGWNPHVKRARRALEAAGITPHYVELGTYASGWRERLAVKMWSGWPTFPQVYVRGVLIGGADQTEQALADGSLKQRLAATP